MDESKRQVLSIASERRLGRYLIDQREWQTTDLRTVRRIQHSFLIVSAVPVKGQPHLTVYTAHSHLFDQIAPGEDPPQYDIRVTQNGNRIEVKRAAPAPEASAIEKMEQALEAPATSKEPELQEVV